MWLACPVIVMRGMQYLRCRCEQLLSASRKRLEAASVCAFATRISTFASTTLKKLLSTCLCGAVMARGHHSVDPSERRTERNFGSTGPGRAKLERAGVNLDQFGEEIRFENVFVLLAMVGIIATRAESAEAA